MLISLPLHTAQYGILFFSLVYLSCVHVYLLLSADLPSRLSHADISAPLMVQTQKLSSLAFNINDGMKLISGIPLARECHRTNAVSRRPRLHELCGYLFCFHNSMIGPFSFFADYLRFIEGREEDRITDPELRERFMKTRNEYRVPMPELWKQVKLLLIHALLFLWAMVSFDTDDFLTDSFRQKNFFQKYIFMSIAGFGFRQRFYFAWTLSCIANLSAGFGFAGFDSSAEPDYGLATNIYFLRIELGTSTKSILDAWNTATTRWLRECIYDRLPSRYAVWAVFVASAIWHGFHPGFYLAFVSAALFTMTGRYCRKYIRPYFIRSNVMHFFYDILTGISAMFVLNYFGVAFLLQKTHKVLSFWRQMNYVGHIAPLALLILLISLNSNKSESASESELRLRPKVSNGRHENTSTSTSDMTAHQSVNKSDKLL